MRHFQVTAGVFFLLAILLSLNSSFAEDKGSTGSPKKESDMTIFLDSILIDTEESNGNDKDHEIREPKPAADADLDKPVLSKEGQKSSGGKEFEEAMDHLREGNLASARKKLSALFFSTQSESEKLMIKTELDKINERLIFSPRVGPGSFVYTVKGGDSLGRIAKEFGTTYELIMRINEKYRSTIRVGEHLKVIKGPFDVLVDKSDFTLTLLHYGDYVKQYRIGTGKNDKTPVGEFEIAEKMKEPAWYSGDGVYEYGHPKNILGTRWMGFKDKPGLYGFGIHGTADPDSIGKSESNGCVRMRNEEVEEVFTFVTNDTKVVIQE